MRVSKVVTAGLLVSSTAAQPFLLSSLESAVDDLLRKTISWNAYILSHLPKVAPVTHHRTSPWSLIEPTSDYLNWTSFKANGVNLGNWLLLEYTSDQTWWNEQVPSNITKDEWSFCEYLGPKCGPLLENHYATYYNFSDIDKLASVGVNLLRIPMSYQAWIDVPTSKLYHGHQLVYFKSITEYAIRKYGMHIVIDLHALPGGPNGLDHGEGLGHYDWWFNQTNMDYTLDMVTKVMNYIQDSTHPQSFSLSLINEAVNNGTAMGTSYGLTDDAVEYLMGYLNQSLAIRDKINPRVPIVWQDDFMGEEFWSARIPTDKNIVVDIHIYFFSSVFTNAYSKYLSYSVCGAGDYFAGDHKFPVFIGEWSNEILYNNSLADRKTNFDTQRYAYATWGSGSSFWSARQFGVENVSGEGIRSNYWCYECMIDDGVIEEATTQSYC